MDREVGTVPTTRFRNSLAWKKRRGVASPSVISSHQESKESEEMTDGEKGSRRDEKGGAREKERGDVTEDKGKNAAQNCIYL